MAESSETRKEINNLRLALKLAQQSFNRLLATLDEEDTVEETTIPSSRSQFERLMQELS